MTAAIESDGTVRPLDGKAAPDAIVTEDDVQEPSKLAKILTRVIREIAGLKRQFVRERIDFEDVEISSSKSVMLAHGFGGRVRYSIGAWSAAGGLPPVLATSSSTDNDTLVLDAYEPVLLYLPSTFTTTAATATSTVLTFPVRAGEYWLVEFWGFAGCDTLNGVKYAIGAPSGTTIDGILDSSLGSATTDAKVQITAVNTLTSAVHTVAANERDDYINARLLIGSTAGSVTIQLASNTAGDTTTLRSLACLRAQRMRAGAATYVAGKATICVEEAG